MEYLTQHFIVPQHIYNQINILRSIFNISLSLSKSFYNPTIHNQLFPNIINLYELQFRFQVSLLASQAFSNLTSQCIIFYFLLSLLIYIWI